MLTGKDVWDAIVKLGLRSGPYDLRTNPYCRNAENIARLLNEVLTKRQSLVPSLVETEDAMRTRPRCWIACAALDRARPLFTIR